jgi:hypothetical protein
MLELGNQRMHDRAIPERTGKEYFLSQGVAEHVSIDLNGRDGSLPIDLAVVHTDPAWRGRFDVVTNFGTSQHVEPRRAQYPCFVNIHNWLRPGGIAIHVVPEIGALERAGLNAGLANNYYSASFFEMLASQNRYTLAYMQMVPDGHIVVCLQKTDDRPFMADRRLLLRHVARRRGGKIYPGINSRGVYMRGRVLTEKLWLVVAGLLAATRPIRHRLGLRKSP